VGLESDKGTEVGSILSVMVGGEVGRTYKGLPSMMRRFGGGMLDHTSG
jgi:hypothetical protein